MSRTVSAVIGANYGDEGKGLVTDWLAQRPGTLVVRFNGGAQAGHTVRTPDGRRHVFHHFGSGSFNEEAVTFLSPYFVAHPIAFLSELRELRALGLVPSVFVDPRCRVTTPYDMMLNQAVETKRGAARHGSCGMGFHETVVRSADPLYTFTVADLRDPHGKLLQIRDVYVKGRVEVLGLELDSMPWLFSNDVLDRFVEDCRAMWWYASGYWWEAVKSWPGDIVFEGAQGLRLDQDHPSFPHVTHSKTGLANVASLMRAARLEQEELQVYYVTRPYLTRHGAGPLPGEIEGLPYPGVVDETNVPNPHQGSLRFALFSVDDFAREVATDLQNAEGLKVQHSIVVTCTNQLGKGGVVRCFDRMGDEYSVPLPDLLDELRQRSGCSEVYVASGETRDDVRAVDTSPQLALISC